MCSQISKILTAAIMIIVVTACSKPPARVNPCNLLTVTEAQSVQGSITEAKWFPRKKGEANELCMYYDGTGEAHLMLFVFDDKSADPLTAIQSGTKGGADRFAEVTGVGEKAAAGLGPPNDILKLFAARSKGGMIGIRVRQPVYEDDENYNGIKMLAITALARLK